ncbi:hypothetical protein [Falsiroseomonas oryzae]|uniref:hypothetical protein n=1 Tax=Falsiroseomonas oryzae TaxID=2766473 RepID=UPI0022EB7A3E|nr:hypothetical protein [Roseomonas sp. MO-31]
MKGEVALSVAAWALPLGKFSLGYLAVNAVPGPNMLAIGTLTVMGGLLAGLPGDTALAQAGRAVGGGMLLLIALRIAVVPRPRPGEPDRQQDRASRRIAILAMVAGCATAATNPITAAYLLAQFVGPFGRSPAAAVAVLVVPAQALAWCTLVACVFSRPPARRLLLANHRASCMAAGAALAALALGMLWPLAGQAGLMLARAGA